MEIEKIEGFDWDKGNLGKNGKTHKVSDIEAEQIFFNKPLVLLDDEKHSSAAEARYYALGITDSSRFLFTAFTIRKNCIRIISARDMSKKERKIYNEEKQSS